MFSFMTYLTTTNSNYSDRQRALYCQSDNIVESPKREKKKSLGWWT